MTAYFDRRLNELRDLTASGVSPWNRLVLEWKDTLLQDITLACEWDRGPGHIGPNAFPEDLRTRAYRCLLDHINGLNPNAPELEFETDDDVMRALAACVEQLHDIFHIAGRRGWGDSPRKPLSLMAEQRDEYLQTMLDAAKDAETAPTPAAASDLYRIDPNDLATWPPDGESVLCPDRVGWYIAEFDHESRKMWRGPVEVEADDPDFPRYWYPLPPMPETPQ